MDGSRATSSSVQVALRIRPQGTREKLEGARICTSVIPNEPQVTIGNDRSFTYDFVFDTPTQQTTIYESCIEKLVDGIFDGYNATVLAYGQTGSGKTFTMGTAFDSVLTEEDTGVIPRAIAHVFHKITDTKREAVENGRMEPTFEVGVQFIELYNEEVIDLLADDRSIGGQIRIHEDNRGEIVLHGVCAKDVQDLHSTIEILKNGALNRTVASTNMNEQSSRSHAIFTMIVKQLRVVAVDPEDCGATGETEVETLSAKFHFVDLAGSERLKRTGATGDRAKEGISINSGLLALGNVISALGGASGKVSHVPYRDSKLTRLLQDSLGGNSRTLMIACVSPSDSDFVETLSTMNYANRAKNIKNKVVANQDKSSKIIGELRSRIAALENELLEFKQGRRTVDGSGVEIVNDQYHENVMLTAEVNQLRFRVKALQETNEILRSRNVDLIANANAAEVASSAIANGDSRSEENGTDPVQQIVRKYLDELERMRSSLYESQATSDQLRKELARWKAQALANGVSVTANALGADSSPYSPSSFSQQQLIAEAKSDLEKMKKSISEAASSGATSDYSSNVDDGDDGTSNDADDIESEDDDEEDGFEETKESFALRENLNDLQNEISIKERLISELEKSERRLAEVRLTYEKKLTELSLRIKQTEAERDRILTEGLEKKTDKGSQEQAKRIREEYERKLNDMRVEFRKLQMVEKEHKRMQAKQERERQELMRYQAELKELKRVKVDLMKKIKEEAKKAQQQSLTNSRRLAALDKESRAKDNKIRNLENKDRQREMFMKRTNEEVNRLKKAQREQMLKMRQMSHVNRTPVTRPGTRTVAANKGKPPPELLFSPKHAKIKWNMIEKKLNRLVSQRQTVGKMEGELERLLKERVSLNDTISNLSDQFVRSTDLAERADYSEQLDATQQKLKYIQEQITESQSAIADLDASKEEDDGFEANEMNDVTSVLENCTNLVEAKYLLEKLFSQSLEAGISVANSQATIKELEARIEQLEKQSSINEQLLTTVIEDKSLANDIEVLLENGLKRKNRSPSQHSVSNRSSSPSIADGSESEKPIQPYKARRRTATTDELLYAVDQKQNEESVGKSSVAVEEEKRESRKFVPLPSEVVATHPPSSFVRTKLRATIAGTSTRSQPTTARRGLARIQSTSRLDTVEEHEASPRSSTPPDPVMAPNKGRKSVFSRLTQLRETSPGELMVRKQGRIVSARNPPASKVVLRSHTLEGHSKAVLGVAATDEYLLSGSKDRTAKLWDLNTGVEVRTLGVHPNSVHAVRFVPSSNLCLSVSMYQVKVWDIRSPDCIRVLQSSGQVINGDAPPVGSRQNTIPFLETMINAIEVDLSGRLLFTSFAGDVRIWDLEKFGSFGRLCSATHSPKSEVSCLAVAQSDDNCPIVFTGSRDHYIKMYAVNSEGEGPHEPVVEFTPPHYDNVTCALAYMGHLYTAGKDMNIMKFALSDYKRDHLELKAHSSYVQGLSLIEGQPDGRPLLASACREGTLKFWDITSSKRLRLVEEISKAHPDGINGMTSNSYMLFTASSDQTIGFWKINQ